MAKGKNKLNKTNSSGWLDDYSEELSISKYANGDRVIDPLLSPGQLAQLNKLKELSKKLPKNEEILLKQMQNKRAQDKLSVSKEKTTANKLKKLVREPVTTLADQAEYNNFDLLFGIPGRVGTGIYSTVGNLLTPSTYPILGKGAVNLVSNALTDENVYEGVNEDASRILGEGLDILDIMDMGVALKSLPYLNKYIPNSKQLSGSSITSSIDNVGRNLNLEELRRVYHNSKRFLQPEEAKFLHKHGHGLRENYRTQNSIWNRQNNLTDNELNSLSDIVQHNNQLPAPPSEIQFMPDGATRTIYNQQPISDISNYSGWGTDQWDATVHNTFDLNKLRKPVNKSGLTKEDVLSKASAKDQEIIAKMSNTEFENTVLKPTGEVVPYYQGDLMPQFTGKNNVFALSPQQYADEFNSRLDLLNDIIAKNNKSGVEYRVKELTPDGRLKFVTPKQELPRTLSQKAKKNLEWFEKDPEDFAINTAGLKQTKDGNWVFKKGPSNDVFKTKKDALVYFKKEFDEIFKKNIVLEGESEWGVRIKPGQWEGNVEDIASKEYLRSIPGLEMSNTASGVFADNIARRGTRAYESINEYLKKLNLGRVKPGFNSQTDYSRGAWENFIKSGKGVGFYNNPNTVYGTMKSIFPYIGIGAASQFYNGQGEGEINQYEDGGIIDTIKEFFTEKTNKPAPKSAPAKSSPKTFKIEDKRKVLATSGQPIRPNVDITSGEYDLDVLKGIIESAKRKKLPIEDVKNLAAIAFQETKFGKTDKNIGHVIDGPFYRSDYEALTNAYINKMKKADKLGIKDDATRLQVYNGLGVIKPSTEQDYHGFKMKKIYGVPVPSTGINMKKNPLYGKQIMDLKDNVLNQNPEYVNYLNTLYNSKDPVPIYSDVELKSWGRPPLLGKFAYGRKINNDMKKPTKMLPKGENAKNPIKTVRKVLPEVIITPEKNNTNNEADWMDYLSDAGLVAQLAGIGASTTGVGILAGGPLALAGYAMGMPDAIRDTYNAYNDSNYGEAALSATGLIPGIRVLNKLTRLQKASDLVNKANKFNKGMAGVNAIETAVDRYQNPYFKYQGGGYLNYQDSYKGFGVGPQLYQDNSYFRSVMPTNIENMEEEINKPSVFSGINDVLGAVNQGVSQATGLLSQFGNMSGNMPQIMPDISNWQAPGTAPKTNEQLNFENSDAYLNWQNDQKLKQAGLFDSFYSNQNTQTGTGFMGNTPTVKTVPSPNNFNWNINTPSFNLPTGKNGGYLKKYQNGGSMDMLPVGYPEYIHKSNVFHENYNPVPRVHFSDDTTPYDMGVNLNDLVNMNGGRINKYQYGGMMPFYSRQRSPRVFNSNANRASAADLESAYANDFMHTKVRKDRQSFEDDKVDWGFMDWAKEPVGALTGVLSTVPIVGDITQSALGDSFLTRTGGYAVGKGVGNVGMGAAKVIGGAATGNVGMIGSGIGDVGEGVGSTVGTFQAKDALSNYDKSGYVSGNRMVNASQDFGNMMDTASGLFGNIKGGVGMVKNMGGLKGMMGNMKGGATGMKGLGNIMGKITGFGQDGGYIDYDFNNIEEYKYGGKVSQKINKKQNKAGWLDQL